MTEDKYWEICSRYNVHFYHKPTEEELEKLDVDEFETQVRRLVVDLIKREEEK